MAQLDDESWLGQGSLIPLLAMCTVGGCRHIELHLPDKATDWPSWEEASTIINLDPSIHTLVAPICRLNHWFLVVVDVRRKTVSHHNPKRTIHDAAASPLMGLVVRTLGLDNSLFAKFPNAPASLVSIDGLIVSPAYKNQTPQQDVNNYHDCGIHVLLTAIYTMVGLPVPSNPDALTWRVIFKIALAQRRHTQADLDVILPPPLPPPALPGPHADYNPSTLMPVLVAHLVAQTSLPKRHTAILESLGQALSLTALLHMQMSSVAGATSHGPSVQVTIEARRDMLSKLGSTPHDQLIRTAIQTAITDNVHELALVNKTKAAVAQISDWHAIIRGLLENCRDRTRDMEDAVEATKRSLLEAQALISEALKGL